MDKKFPQTLMFLICGGLSLSSINTASAIDNLGSHNECIANCRADYYEAQQKCNATTKEWTTARRACHGRDALKKNQCELDCITPETNRPKGESRPAM